MRPRPRLRLIRPFLVALLTVFLLVVGACSRPAEAPAGSSPSSEAKEPAGTTRVSIPTGDGLRLEGVIIPQWDHVETKRTAVVLGHMFPSDQTSWWPVGNLLAGEGYTVLTFNFRGYGRSQGSKEIGQIDRDLEAALAFVREKGFDRVFLVGASMGGTAAVIVAGRQEVAGVAALSAPQAFQGLDATQAIRSVAEPALFIAAEQDGEAAEAARGYADSSGGPACAFIVPGSRHGTEMLGPGGNPSQDREAVGVYNVLTGFLSAPVSVAKDSCPR